MSAKDRNNIRGTILVVDDEENMAKILNKVLTMEGFHVTTFNNPVMALDFLRQTPTDVVLSDIRMPEMSGRDFLIQLKEDHLPSEVIMMTAHGTIEGAIDCVKQGAYNYITKPFKTDELLVTLNNALEHKRLKDVNTALSDAWNKIPDDLSSEKTERGLIGDSPAMQRVRDLIDRVAPSQSPVLITGESGTGKELVARAIHSNSARNKGRFVAINCASIPETLIESELFGHERGAFTGAGETKIGLIELADGGTLFLDEIGELPLSMQAKLLRVLQEREVTRVGGLANIAVDIRVVSATNRNLTQCIEEKVFREDLFYRLNVIAIELPALRERREDIPVLAEHFLRLKGGKHSRPELEFSENALEGLSRMSWNGNVRELENVIERLVVLAETDVITTDLLPDEAAQMHRSSTSSERVTRLGLSAQAMVEEVPDFRSARESFEREYLEALLRAQNGNVTEAARHAGMSRRNLYDKIEKLGIDLNLIKGESGKEL